MPSPPTRIVVKRGLLRNTFHSFLFVCSIRFPFIQQNFAFLQGSKSGPGVAPPQTWRVWNACMLFQTASIQENADVHW